MGETGKALHASSSRSRRSTTMVSEIALGAGTGERPVAGEYRRQPDGSGDAAERGDGRGGDRRHPQLGQRQRGTRAGRQPLPSGRQRRRDRSRQGTHASLGHPIPSPCLATHTAPGRRGRKRVRCGRAAQSSECYRELGRILRTDKSSTYYRGQPDIWLPFAVGLRPPAPDLALMVEERQQDDDRQRNAQHPEKNTTSHLKPPSDPTPCEAEFSPTS